MGSCYSCKSGQQAHAYTTTTMSATEKADPAKNRIGPYSRGSSSSFGFNKRRIPTTLKSLSQDRTSELVNNYESKIANINANNIALARSSPKHVNNRLLQSQIPRFGFKSSSTSSLGSSEDLHSSNSSLANTDPNSNIVIIEKCANKTVPKTKTANTVKSNNAKKRSQENSPELRRLQVSTKVVPVETANATNVKTASKIGFLKPPTKVVTSVSGLPKPQTIRKGEEPKDAKKKINLAKSVVLHQAPLAQFDEVEAMQISSDGLPDEDGFNLDSGLGNSDVSDKRDGDNETIGSASEIASDTASIGRNSKERTPEKVPQNRSIPKPDGGKVRKEIARPGGLQLKARPAQKQSTDKKREDLEKKIASRFNQEDDFGDDSQSTISVPLVNETSKATGSLAKKRSEESNQDKQSLKPQDDKLMVVSSTSMGSNASQPESITEVGAISPPSERDTFLIDDEICDQPGLIACESFLNSSQEFFGRNHHQDPFAEDGGNEGMAVFRSGSLDTLSSSSSINSNDLMLDFDPADETAHLESINRRLTCEECEENSADNMKPKDNCRHGARELKLQGGESTFEVIDEWNNLLETHSKDGTPARPRARRTRAASSPVIPSTERILRPPRQMTAAEAEDGGIIIDPSSYRSMSQDVTNMKTMLLKLKRVLQESDTLNPFETHNLWKNGLFHSLAHTDPPRGVDIKDNQTQIEEVTQENSDLRRQVVFLQQQLDEKDRTIHLLQQQMTKYANSMATSTPQVETTNAATQTNKPRLSLTSMSQTLEESSLGTTVSSNKTNGITKTISKRLSQQPSQVTCSLNSLPTPSTSSSENNSSTKSSLTKNEKSASASDLTSSQNSAPEAASEGTRQRSRIASRLPSFKGGTVSQKNLKNTSKIGNGSSQKTSPPKH